MRNFGTKRGIYYFINGEPNYTLTQLAYYIPNFKVTKEPNSKDAIKVLPVMKEKVVNPSESGALLVANTVLEGEELLKLTNSEKFVEVLENKVYTNTSGSLYHFRSDIKGFEEAKKEFDSMNLANMRTYPNGTIAGELPNGDTVNLHPSKSVGVPSIEIQDAVNTKINIKIRY